MASAFCIYLCGLCLALAALMLPQVAPAQSLGGQFVPSPPAGGFLDVMIQIQAQVDPTFKLGPTTLQFSYNTSALAFPDAPADGTDFTYAAFHNSTNGNYTSDMTSPTPGQVSANIFIFSAGNGTDVDNAAMMDVVQVRFQILDPAQTTGLTWDLCEYSSDDFTLQESSCALFANLDAPLPVELTTFDAHTEGESVTLTWATASETNNAGFEIQMMHRDAVDPGVVERDAAWQTLAFVPGAGTTVEVQTYRHTVADLGPGSYRFRLKQVDFDGAFAYSDVVEARVELVGQYRLAQAFPNPFGTSAEFNLALAEGQPVRIELYDATGRLVRVLHDGWLRGQETHRFTLNADALPSGMYLYRVVGDGLHAHRSVTIVR